MTSLLVSANAEEVYSRSQRQHSRQAQAFGQCNFHGEFLLWERVKTIKQG
jgi:desulfoferrodoxin (superoxide reductase-like protein)